MIDFSFEVRFILIGLSITLTLYNIKSIVKKSNIIIDNKNDIIITQYNIPKWTEIMYLFYLRYIYEHDISNLYSSIIYYRYSQWWINITQHSWKHEYRITEKKIKPHWTSHIDDILLQQLFGLTDEQWYDQHIHSIVLNNEYAQTKLKRMIKKLEFEFNKMDFVSHNRFLFWLYRTQTLSEKWKKILLHLKWYKKYLISVEWPIILQQMKQNQNYINEIFPRALLFWIENNLATTINNLWIQNSIIDFDTNNLNMKTHIIKSLKTNMWFHKPDNHNDIRDGFLWEIIKKSK